MVLRAFATFGQSCNMQPGALKTGKLGECANVAHGVFVKLVRARNFWQLCVVGQAKKMGGHNSSQVLLLEPSAYSTGLSTERLLAIFAVRSGF